MNSSLPILFKTKNSFPGQQEDEEVIFVIRRHPLYISIKIILITVIALTPIALWMYYAQLVNARGLTPAALLGVVLWAALLWQAAFYALTMYTLDVWIVSNKRIILSSQIGFFNRTISELHLSRIQDISVSTNGVIQTFLHFGDLEVQTAGSEEHFNFLQIPHPERVKDEIMRLSGTHRNPLHV